MSNPFLFAFTIIAILATPGPTNTLIATSGATVGFQRSLRLVPIEAAGYLIAVLLVGLLLRPLLIDFPMIAKTFRVLVGVYLLLLAIGLWRCGRAVRAIKPIVGPKQVFAITLLNPKAIVFALGIIPFGAHGLWLYLAGFVILITVVSIGWIAFGATLGAAAAATGRGGYFVPRLGATVIGAFAVLLVAGPYVALLIRNQ